jgi:hypothetical protein
MDRFPFNRLAFGFVLGLSLMGGLALAGLVSPLAKGYLSEKPRAGGIAIQTSSPMVRVHFVPYLAHGRLLRGRDMAAPVCDREPGRV